MPQPEKLPDSEAWLDGKLVRLVDRILVSEPQSEIIDGKRVDLPPLTFVVSTARPA